MGQNDKIWPFKIYWKWTFQKTFILWIRNPFWGRVTVKLGSGWVVTLDCINMNFKLGVEPWKIPESYAILHIRSNLQNFRNGWVSIIQRLTWQSLFTEIGIFVYIDVDPAKYKKEISSELFANENFVIQNWDFFNNEIFWWNRNLFDHCPVAACW